MSASGRDGRLFHWKRGNPPRGFCCLVFPLKRPKRMPISTTTTPEKGQFAIGSRMPSFYHDRSCDLSVSWHEIYRVLNANPSVFRLPYLEPERFCQCLPTLIFGNLAVVS